MKFSSVIAYYRDLRFSNLRSEKYRHLFLILYWPLYGFAFLTLERLVPLINPDVTYHAIACGLDDLIPFCEFWIFPYYFWFVFMVGMGAFTLLFDVRAFRRFMWFVILTYTVTTVVYIVYPNMQELRPTEFARDNFCTDVVKFLYGFDTNTNVCPSIHVLGSVAVLCAGYHSPYFKSVGWKIFLIAGTVLISISTVFLKQHSIIDVFAAAGLSAVCYPITLWITSEKRERKRAAKKAGDGTDGADA